MKRFHNILTSLFTAALVLFIGFAAPAQAIAPAGSKLSITVKVTHGDDTSGADEEFAGATVRLLPAPPTLSAPSDQTGLSGDNITYSYTITTNANGLDEYNLSAVVTPDSNVASAPSVSFEVDSGGIIFVELGATVASVLQTTGSDSVVVPHDGSTDASAVNGIQANDTVVIGGAGGAEYEVSQVSYDAAINSKVILLKTPLVSAVQVGDLVLERQSFTMTVSGTSLVGTESAGTVGIVVTATSVADSAFSVADESITSVITPISPSLETYARNETELTTGTAVAYRSISGDEYFAMDAVTAKSGDIVQYAIVQNAGNTGPMTDVVIKASMPTFAAYVAGSTTWNGVVVPDNGDVSAMLLGAGTDCVFDDPAECDIPKDGKAEVTFKVEVDGVAATTTTPSSSDSTTTTDTTTPSSSSSTTTTDTNPMERPPARVAWKAGNDACWDHQYFLATSSSSQEGDGWVQGECVAKNIRPPNPECMAGKCKQTLCNHWAQVKWIPNVLPSLSGYAFVDGAFTSWYTDWAKCID